MQTGWISEQPEQEPPARRMPVTDFLASVHSEGRTLGEIAARAMRPDKSDRAPGPRDPDEAAANLLSKGYSAGMISGLTMQLSDMLGDLEAERSRIEKGERVTERVRGLLERGQIGAREASAMMDADLGDEARAGQLQQRAESLRAQIAEAARLIAPPQLRDPDPVEAASARAAAAAAQAARGWRP